MKSGQCYPIGLCLDCQGRIKSSLFFIFFISPHPLLHEEIAVQWRSNNCIRPTIWSVCMFSMMSNFLRPFSFFIFCLGFVNRLFWCPNYRTNKAKESGYPSPLFFLHKRELDNEDLRRWWASWSVRLLGHYRFRPKKPRTLSYCHSNSEQLLALSLKQKNMLNPGGRTGYNSPSVRVLLAFSIVYVRVLCARARALLLCNARR